VKRRASNDRDHRNKADDDVVGVILCGALTGMTLFFALDGY
jgi:hypothetical protein